MCPSTRKMTRNKFFHLEINYGFSFFTTTLKCYLFLVQSMQEDEPIKGIPAAQKMDRQASLVKEHQEQHRAAIERAISLEVPQAYSSSYGTFQEPELGENSSSNTDFSYSSLKRREMIDEMAPVLDADHL